MLVRAYGCTHAGLHWYGCLPRYVRTLIRGGNKWVDGESHTRSIYSVKSGSFGFTRTRVPVHFLCTHSRRTSRMEKLLKAMSFVVLDASGKSLSVWLVHWHVLRLCRCCWCTVYAPSGVANLSAPKVYLLSAVPAKLPDGLAARMCWIMDCKMIKLRLRIRLMPQTALGMEMAFSAMMVVFLHSLLT